MSPVRFLPAAEAELLAEIDYYAHHAREGTGKRFESAVQVAASLAARYPLAGVPSYKNTRTVLVRGFPFSLVYRASEREVLVVAIAPHPKRPLYWASRLP